MNLGVAASRRCFSLENRAKNIADFGIPDERQNQPINQPICDKYGIEDCFFTELNLENMLSHLKVEGVNIEKSESAGEYICNYMFYRNIETSQRI